MSRKKTALQAAIERENRSAGDVAKKRIGSSILVGLSLGLALLCIAQAVAVLRDSMSRTQIAESQRQSVAALTGAVAEIATRVRGALSDPLTIANALPRNDAAAQHALVRLRERYPDVQSVAFYSPDLSELLTEDLEQFGYTRANALSEARTGAGRAQLVGDEGARGLAIAHPVSDGGRLVSYAYVVADADALVRAFEAVAISGGRIEVYQGARPALPPRGDAPFGEAQPERVAIPGSTLAIVSTGTTHFKVGEAIAMLDTENVVMLFLSALLLALVAGGTVWWRRGMPLPAKAGEEGTGKLEQMRDKMMGKQTVKDEPVVPQVVPVAKAPPAPVAVRKDKAGAAATATATATPGVVDRSIFRAYDIRGVVDRTLTPDVAKLIGQAIGTVAIERGLKEVVVGRDGRLSGPMLANALSLGLRAAGVDVIDIGAVPTPVLYFATFHLNVGSGVSVTGSHNPPDYNGFKIMLGGETLAEDAIQDLYSRIVEGRLAKGSGGIQQIDVNDAYLERISGDIQLEKKLRVVVDAGNGIAGAIAPQVLSAIGCEVEPLYCEVDGEFPNHHPDPSDPHNLKDLILAVKHSKADLGLAFDGDGDRLGVVTQAGEIIYPDRLLMLFAIDVLTRAPGAPIIYDVKCTGHLQDMILRHGGSPIMWKTGHSLIKAKMKLEDAELAGEMSGHFFFRERWFGFDDGIYSAARLCEIIAAREETPEAIFAELPKGVSTPELKVEMVEGEHYAYVAKFKERSAFPGARITTIDGVRADYPDGWGLVRCSNTTPSLVLRFDADSQDALSRIQETFRAQMLAIDPKLALPF